MSISELIDQMRNALPASDAELRKYWAGQVIDRDIELSQLITLFHGERQVAQRFMWFIGDVCELDPDRVSRCLPLLFELRDAMPFPGMRRSVAKWLWHTGVPEEINGAAGQLLEWITDPEVSIACKSFSAKALELLVRQGRISPETVIRALGSQFGMATPAFGRRMRKVVENIKRFQ